MDLDLELQFNVYVERDELASFITHQNGIKFIKKIIIENKTLNKYENLKLKIEGNPNFFECIDMKIDLIPVGNIIELDLDDKLILSNDYLMNLKESINASYKIQIIDGLETLYEKVFLIQLLAPNQWLGTRYYPYLISSFVMPNNDRVDILIKKSSLILEKIGLSFSAYQNDDVNDVLKQVESLYQTVCNEHISYTVAPASFENYGQKIRFINDIIDSKLANCLDLSILFASLLEAVGLNSFIVMLDKHAFVGCWLENICYNNTIEDDYTQLSKNLAKGMKNIVIFEATAITDLNPINFETAIKMAEEKLTEKNFEFIVDVKRSRLIGVKPMPIYNYSNRVYQQNNEIKIQNNEINSNISIENKDEIKFDSSKEQDTITRWKNKLLNFGMRNNFLNLRSNRRQIQIFHYNIAEVVKKIYQDDIQLFPREKEIKLKNDSYFDETQLSLENFKDLNDKDLKKGLVMSSLTEDELIKRLNKINNESKNYIEETGSNALYLSFGLLKWYEKEKPNTDRYAPIILLPVEMVRKNNPYKYVIRLREDEAIINPTLLEKIRQDFNVDATLLSEIVNSKDEVDIDEILYKFRQLIRNVPKWDVLDKVFLEMFTFNQFVMWKDLVDREDEISEHKIIKSIIEQKIDERITIFNGDMTVDNKFLENNEIANLLPSDSSQLTAILSSNENKSFVLHGPPGTGKSQTITNIISTALFNGKKVLFVAEKLEALRVVQKRLSQIGLGEFALEIHSNKTKKNEILEHLSKTLELKSKGSVLEYTETLKNLSEKRKEIQNQAYIMHTTNEYGYSIYDLISKYFEVKDVKENYFVDKNELETFNKIKLEKNETIIATYVEHYKDFYPISKNSLRYITNKRINYEQRQELINYLNKFLNITDDFKIQIMEPLSNVFGIIENQSYNDLEMLSILVKKINGAKFIDKIFYDMNEDEVEDQRTYFDNMIKKVVNTRILKNEILEIFDKDIFKVEIDTLIRNWNYNNKEFILMKYVKNKKILKEVRKYEKEEVKIKFKMVYDAMKKIQTYNNEYEELVKMFNQNKFLKNESIEDIDVEHFIEKFETSVNIYELLKKISVQQDEKLVLKIEQYKKTYLNDFEKLIKIIDKVDEIISCNENIIKIINYDLDKNEINFVQRYYEIYKNIVDKFNLLSDWMIYLEKKYDMIDNNLGHVVELLENEKILYSDAISYYKKSLFEAKINEEIEKKSILFKYNKTDITKLIDDYSNETNDYLYYLKEELRNKLISKIPKILNVSNSMSELFTLKKAISNNGRGTSIRNLITKTKTIIGNITPCFLMSPISVAQYLDKDINNFDIIIFDEASQVTTHNAVGAISRAKEVIIVGDGKQLPPTSFFQKQIDEDDLEIENIDSASILEECISCNIPSLKLKWHYRSQHESLIDFSNKTYYNYDLYTFPSIDNEESKVKMKYIDGLYDKGNTKTNLIEAKEVVNEIGKRLRDEKTCNQSIGVITLNKAQQNLIMDLYENLKEENPDVAIAESKLKEPIIIKNLENIQGEERDVILISLTFGPNKNGKPTMNFGPLSQKGGERRLNVAFSRAKSEMILFSSLKVSDIDLRRVEHQGVKDLKKFMEFAEENKLTIRSIQHEYHDTLLEIIEDRIRELGYKVSRNVGNSKFKVDIGIFDPENENIYLLGIVLDGKKYWNTPSVDDRISLQRTVLEQLGWKIHNLWSTEWFKDSQKCLEEISQKIQKIQTKTENNDLQKNEKVREITYRRTEENIIPYILYNKFDYIDLDQIYNNYHNNRLKEIIINILLVEQPITKDLLMTRISKIIGYDKVGSKMNLYFSNLLKNMVNENLIIFNENYYFNKNQDENIYKKIRFNTDQFQRSVEQLPNIEIEETIKYLVINHGGILIDDIYLEIGKIFGFKQTSQNMRDTFKVIIDKMLNKGILKILNGILYLNN